MPDTPPPLTPDDEELLGRAGASLVRRLGPPRAGARDAVQRARTLARRRRAVRYGTTVAIAAAVAAAIAVPLSVTGAPSASRILPAHSGTTTTTAPPVGTTTTTAPPATTTTTVPPTTATTVPPGTQTLTYDPFTATGAVKPTLTVTPVPTANCVSEGVAGLGSYRCFGAQGTRVGILDPCFPAPGATSGTLVCPRLPTSTSVYELTVSALPSATPGSPTGTRDWAIQLTDGQVCTWVNAAWGTLGPFDCVQTPGQFVDCHPAVAGTPWWSAPCQTEKRTTSPFTEQRVTRVWS